MPLDAFYEATIEAVKFCVRIPLCVLALMCSLAAAQTVRLEDSSDWWSISSGNLQLPNSQGGKEEIGTENFEIFGARLGEHSFEDLAAKLGTVTVIARGDGETGRHQACYVFSNSTSTTHLILESSEEGWLFYLFSAGSEWKGSQYCATVAEMSSISTQSGLRLGITVRQLEKILGKPDVVHGDTVFYSRAFQRKLSRAQFERQRKQYPKVLTDKEAHEKLDYYAVDQYIVAKFAKSRLAYLAVCTDGD